MTRRQPERTGWPLGAWMLVAISIVGVGVAVAAEVLSPVVALDLVSLWPVAALSIPLAVLAFGRRRRHPRWWALPPLILFTWLAIGTALHLAGWPLLPSTSAGLAVADPGGFESVALTVAVAGARLTIGPGSDGGLYRVDPLPIGGDLGVPRSRQNTEGVTAQIVITPAQVDWFRFGGWALDLGPGVQWDLQITAARIEADFSDVAITEAVLVAESGSVRVGEGSGLLRLDGNLIVLVPPTVAARVEGRAVVPAGWETTADGFRAPVTGPGWTIQVTAGSVVEVIEAS